LKLFKKVKTLCAHTVIMIECCDCCKITEGVSDLINDSSSHDELRKGV